MLAAGSPVGGGGHGDAWAQQLVAVGGAGPVSPPAQGRIKQGEGLITGWGLRGPQIGGGIELPIAPTE